MKNVKRLIFRKIAQGLADAGPLSEKDLILTKDLLRFCISGAVQSTRNI